MIVSVPSVATERSPLGSVLQMPMEATAALAGQRRYKNWKCTVGRIAARALQGLLYLTHDNVKSSTQ